MKSPHIANRDEIEAELFRELIGPDVLQGATEIDPDLHPTLTFEQRNEQAPFVDPQGEEILFLDTPGKRYGVGVLYPTGANVPLDRELGEEDGECDLEDERPEFQSEGELTGVRLGTDKGVPTQETGRFRSLDG